MRSAFIAFVFGVTTAVLIRGFAEAIVWRTKAAAIHDDH
jgi:hypothetical protein